MAQIERIKLWSKKCMSFMQNEGKEWGILISIFKPYLDAKSFIFMITKRTLIKKVLTMFYRVKYPY